MNKRYRSMLLACLVGTGAMYYYKQKHGNEVQPNGKKGLHLALRSSIDGLDPAKTTSYGSVSVAGKVYEALLEYHYLKRPHELVPGLAEAMPTVSADGLTYTFEIKKGVRFQDDPCFPNGIGRELKAEDFVYSLKRIADPQVQSPYFEEVGRFIQGFDDLHRHFQAHPGDYTFPVEGLTALGPHTLRFRLNAPFALALHSFALMHFSVVAREAVEHYGSNFLNHPVGTGPFRLESFNPQDNRIVFVKNPTFRDKFYPTEAAPKYQHLLASAGKKLPLVDKLVYHILPESQPRLLEFRNKKLDILEIEGVHINNVLREGQLSEDLTKKGVQLFQESPARLYFFGFNCLKAPLNQKKIRQAMSLAFDREAFNKLFGHGLAKIPHSIIPESFDGFDGTFRNPYVAFDLEKAKKLLAEAGYPEGKGLPTINLETHTSTGDIRQKADFFAKCMTKIGITVNVETMPFPILCRKLRKKEYMISLLGAQPSIPDAFECFLSLRDPSICSGISILDPTFNACYDRAVLLQDKSKRLALYRSMDQRRAELVPALLLPLPPTLFLAQDRVRNFCIVPHILGMEQYLDVR